MALGGDLKNIKLADIFQTLSMNRQVGTLVVVSSGIRKMVFFSEGGVSLVSERTISAFRLGQYLCGTGKITSEDLRVALTRQHETGLFLGETLVELGLCRMEDVEEVVRYHAAEELYEIFTWDHGSFEFHEGARSEEEAAASPYSRFSFDPGGLVMEAARRIDEWELIRQTLPSEDDFYLRTGMVGDRLDPSVHGHDLAGVYALVDGVRAISDIFAEHHLSKFDSGTVLVRLIEQELIRPLTFDELTSASNAFLARKDSDKGTQCLERAHALQPTDVETIVKLAECYEHLDEKKSAARLLLELGQLFLDNEETAEAVNALEKAEKYDPGSIEAPSLLFRIYLDLGDTEAAAEKARSAAELLCERDLFEQAASLCNEVLAEMPDHTVLRITRANALLGMGLKEAALEELEEIATALEESRSYRTLPEIYRKILQLDSSRREYLHRLEDLKEGRVRRKQRVVRVGVGAGALAMVVIIVLAMGFVGGDSVDDQLNAAWDLYGKGNLIEAKRAATEILDGRDPASDAARRAQSLLATIWRDELASVGPTAAALNEFKLKLSGFTGSAITLFEDGKYGQGLDQMMALAEFLGTEECRKAMTELPRKKVNVLRKSAVDDVGKLLESYSEHLKSLVEKERERLNEYAERNLDKEDLGEVETICNTASEIRDSTISDSRDLNISTAKLIESQLRPGDDGRITKALAATDLELDELHTCAESLHHRARALIRHDEVRRAFTDTMAMLNRLLFEGELEKARIACRDYLSMCETLAAESPAQHYRQVVESLLGEGGLNLDGKITVELEKVELILGTIEAAEALILERRYAEANDKLRTLVRDHLRINLSDRVRLVVWVRTRPIGATVQLFWNGEALGASGHTTKDGHVVRYPPHLESRILIEKDTFDPEEMKIADFSDKHDAEPFFELSKKPEWRRDSGGPVEATPIPAGDVVLVPSRDGHLRGLAIEDGSLRSDHDTGLLGGFQCSPVLSGNLAFLSAIDRKLLAFDLEKWEVAWSVPTEAALRTEAVMAGSRLVVADAAGMAYGIEVKTGKEAWRRQLAGTVIGNPVAHGDSVYLGTTDGIVYKLSAADGGVVWQRQVGGPVRASLAHDGGARIIVGTEHAMAVALEDKDGGILWSTKLDDSPRGRVVLADGHAHLTTLGGTIYRISLDEGRRVIAFTLPDKSPIPGGLTLGNGCVYVVGAAGTLYSVCLKQSVLQWKYVLGGSQPPAPLVHEGRLYVANEQGEVYCFRE